MGYPRSGQIGRRGTPFEGAGRIVERGTPIEGRPPRPGSFGLSEPTGPQGRAGRSFSESGCPQVGDMGGPGVSEFADPQVAAGEAGWWWGGSGVSMPGRVTVQSGGCPVLDVGGRGAGGSAHRPKCLWPRRRWGKADGFCFGADLVRGCPSIEGWTPSTLVGVCRPTGFGGSQAALAELAAGKFLPGVPE